MPTSQDQPTPSKPKKQPDHSYMQYANMGFQMAAIIGIGVWGGIKLDGLTGLQFPVFTIVLSLFAVIAAIYFVVKDLLKK